MKTDIPKSTMNRPNQPELEAQQKRASFSRSAIYYDESQDEDHKELAIVKHMSERINHTQGP
jgi:hypothetical protein